LRRESFIDPEYFRMLRDRRDLSSQDESPPSSPIRRMVEPRPRDSASPPSVPLGVEQAEFVSSSPAVNQGARIRRQAFAPRYYNDFFVEEKELGRGGKGVVLLVRHEIDGCHLGQFACKRVPVGDDHAWLEKVLVEVELLAKLSHPNLVSYRHVWLEDVQLSRFGPKVACAFILQQYCNGGDLLRYIIGEQPKEATKEELKAQMRRKSRGHAERPREFALTHRQLHFDEIYSLFRDITSGLVYLHSSNYIHRDLKPSNCLLHQEGKVLTCLISDFGEVQAENAVRNSSGSTGTISYCAPEVLTRDPVSGRYGNFTTKSDIFSLGMILYFMCFGRLPYKSANTVQEELEDADLLRAEIIDWKGFQDERRERPDLPSKLYQLLKQMLALDPLQRPTAVEVLSAMKTDSHTDGVPRPGRSTSPSSLLGVSGRRVLNLDSPMPPGTPTSEPRAPGDVPFKDYTRVSGKDDEGPEASHDYAKEADRDTLARAARTQQSHSNTRYRSQAMAMSRSQDSLQRRTREGSVSPSIDQMETPLLMPPPSTFLSGVRHRVIIAQHQSLHFLWRYQDILSFASRLLVFLIKMASVARPCWPYTLSLGIGTGLVALAGADLGLAESHRRLLFTSGAREQAQYAISPTFQNPAVREARNRTRAVWRWDWRTSVALFAIHFIILWGASRSGILCASPVDRWSEWT
jgi:serine/threonine protein kinase